MTLEFLFSNTNSQVECKDGLKEKDRLNIENKLLESMREQQSEWGLDFIKIEFRGSWDVKEIVPDKIRAYGLPEIDYTTPGHDLSPDYWGDMLTPKFFFRNKFGSQKDVVTRTAPSWEWSIPSPPDFHHFNQLPRVCVAPEEEELHKLAEAKLK